jgi:hypothetical protein
MAPQKQRITSREWVEQKLTNKTFYRFVFSFVAVIAGVLFFVLVLGMGSEV